MVFASLFGLAANHVSAHATTKRLTPHQDLLPTLAANTVPLPFRRGRSWVCAPASTGCILRTAAGAAVAGPAVAADTPHTAAAGHPSSPRWLHSRGQRWWNDIAPQPPARRRGPPDPAAVAPSPRGGPPSGSSRHTPGGCRLARR